MERLLSTGLVGTQLSMSQPHPPTPMRDPQARGGWETGSQKYNWDPSTLDILP